MPRGYSAGVIVEKHAFSARLDKEVFAKVLQAAIDGDRSVNAQINRILKLWFASGGSARG